MDDTTELTVDTSGVRLDRFVADHLPELSRAAVQRLIEDGNVRVNRQPRKASYRVQIGEAIIVRVPPPAPVLPGAEGARAQAIPLDIIYEDDDTLVINKPAGMVVHPVAGHADGTLVNAILAHCPHLSVGGVERPGIVHRLDSETSGVIVVAKNDTAMRDLQVQFKARRVHKTYLALVEGHVKPPRGKIDAPIGRDPKHRQRMTVSTRGRARAAVTLYRTLANLTRPERGRGAAQSKDAGRYTLLEAQPQTGRTHQIRVHLAFLGFPVAGDSVYGSRTPRSSVQRMNRLALRRQFLHAWKIEFALPRTGQSARFVAPLPEDLRAVLAELAFDASALR